MRPCVFLDRDDTVIANREVTARSASPGDLFDPALVRLLPGVAAACATLARAGFALVVVTNQACIAKGLATCAQVEATNDRVRELLRASGVALDAVYYSPFHEEGRVERFRGPHPWRKPGPGMILAAAEELGLDIAASWMVGDAERDMQAGRAAGIDHERCILIGGGNGWRGAPDLAAAAGMILARSIESGLEGS